MLFWMVTLLALTNIAPLTSFASMTVFGVVTVISELGDSTVPVGTPVFVASGLTPGVDGMVVQRPELGGGAMTGANRTDLLALAVVSATILAGYATEPVSGSATINAVAAWVRVKSNDPTTAKLHIMPATITEDFL